MDRTDFYLRMLLQEFLFELTNSINLNTVNEFPQENDVDKLIELIFTLSENKNITTEYFYYFAGVASERALNKARETAIANHEDVKVEVGPCICAMATFSVYIGLDE